MAVQISGNDITVPRDGTFSRNVSIAGTLTYEDVTNVDSIGLVTARNGIEVGASPGVAASISVDGNAIFSGITTTNGVKINASPAITIRDGTTEKGYIGFNGNDPFIGRKSGVGVAFQNNKIRPVDGDDGSGSNNTVDIGENTYKFKDAYFSGTVTANAYAGDGSALTGISVGIATTAASMSGITTVLDLSKDDFKVTASGITTVDVRGGTEGNNHVVRIVNSGITTVGFSTYFLFPSGGTPALPTADGAISLISFTVHRQGAVGLATQLLAGSSVNFS